MNINADNFAWRAEYDIFTKEELIRRVKKNFSYAYKSRTKFYDTYMTKFTELCNEHGVEVHWYENTMLGAMMLRVTYCHQAVQFLISMQELES